jgi:hypothetical protein
VSAVPAAGQWRAAKAQPSGWAGRKMVAIGFEGAGQFNFDIVPRFNSCNSASHRQSPESRRNRFGLIAPFNFSGALSKIPLCNVAATNY